MRRDNSVTFASVHFKTSRTGGAAGHGFPDLGYLERVSQELDAVGVPDADVMGFSGAMNPSYEQQLRDVKLTPAASAVLTMLSGDSTTLSALGLKCASGHPLKREPVVWRSDCDKCNIDLGPGCVRYTCEECDSQEPRPASDFCVPCAVSLND